MAIDIRKGTHVSSFPTLISSMMNTYKRVYNIVLTADTDNGALAARGDYVSFDNYEQDAVADNAVTVAIRELGADGRWIVEVTALPATEVLYLYNSPVSEYRTRELQDETLYYNVSGEVVQGAPLLIGDLFSLSENAFTGTVAAGKTAKYAGGKYVVQ
jgi:hypothetical protein